MQNPNAIVTYEQAAIEDVKRLVNIVVGLRNDVFVENVDFGVIPGTGDKPTLLQPGMEKLLKALHLRAEYVERSKIEDFDKGLFFYRYECRLVDWETGICVGTAIGSANSHEKKWRWRDQKRKCPVCGKEAIIKGNAEYGGGWLCWKKQAGCGAKFPDGDKRIEDQQVGVIENPDIFDQMNTCDKIAQKRSLGSAIKTVANVSMLYTIDLEDFQQFDTRGDVIQGNFKVTKPEPEEHGQKSAAEPSASVKGAGIPSAAKPAPSPEEPDMIQQHPQADDGPPNLYHCDRLIVSQNRTAKNYFLGFAGSANGIVVSDVTPLVDLDVRGVPVPELGTGTHSLSPSWSVYGEREPNGKWVIENIVTAIPV